MNFYCVLGSMCRNDDAGKKYIEFPCKFRDEEHYDIVKGDSYDTLYEVLGKWLSTHYPGYYIEDVIECQRILSADEFKSTDIDLTV